MAVEMDKRLWHSHEFCAVDQPLPAISNGFSKAEGISQGKSSQPPFIPTDKLAHYLPAPPAFVNVTVNPPAQADNQSRGTRW